MASASPVRKSASVLLAFSFSYCSSIDSMALAVSGRSARTRK